MRRDFASSDEFTSWHENAKDALGLPRVGRNALTGQLAPDKQRTTAWTALDLDEDGQQLLTAEVAPEGDHHLEDVATLVRADLLTADELTALAERFPVWQAGEAVQVGDLRSYDGRLYKCIQAHTTQADWQPPNVPALWVDTAPPDVIPEWRQPTGAHDAYAFGDRVTHNGVVWESLVNANVWEPGAPGTASLWKQVG